MKEVRNLVNLISVAFFDRIDLCNYKDDIRSKLNANNIFYHLILQISLIWELIDQNILIFINLENDA